MKSILLLSFTLLFSIISFSQQVPIEIKDKYFPPNTAEIKENFLYISTTELSNIDYTEYLLDIRKRSEDEYTSNLPDTLVWRSKLAYNEPYVDYYFRHPAYRSYPVVGLTYEQATNYCKWLTKKLNELYAKDDKSPIKEVLVRLPRKAEWEEAARGGQGEHVIFPWGTENVRVGSENKKFNGQMYANFVRGRGDYMGVAGRLNDHADVTAPVQSYWPNPLGIYNMSGNVAEMVLEEGIVKGGSWRDRAYYIRIDVDQNTELPSSQVGFRYMVEVTKFKANDYKNRAELSAKLIESQLAYIPAGSCNGFKEQNGFVRTAVQSFESFHVSKFETSNQLYQYFLEDLEVNNPADADKFAPNDDNWKKEMPYLHLQEYSSHPAYKDYPVTNISHEAAVAFCDWLTKKYNAFPDKKFDSLKFRLPTRYEWRYAAKGNLSLSPYPWGGPYLRNAQGCYLANFAPFDERFHKYSKEKGDYYEYPDNDTTKFYTHDGGYFTLPIDSYHPNNYGLYNMSGNVSEMVSEKGICKGGSWKSMQYYLQIGHADNSSDKPYVDNRDPRIYERFNGADPRVGFRFVAATSDDTEYKKD